MSPTPGYLEHQAARLRELARRADLYADDAEVLLDDVVDGAGAATWTGRFALDTTDRLAGWRRDQRAGAGLLREDARHWRRLAADYDRYATTLREQERLDRERESSTGPR